MGVGPCRARGNGETVAAHVTTGGPAKVSLQVADSVERRFDAQRNLGVLGPKRRSGSSGKSCRPKVRARGGGKPGPGGRRQCTRVRPTRPFKKQLELEIRERPALQACAKAGRDIRWRHLKLAGTHALCVAASPVQDCWEPAACAAAALQRRASKSPRCIVPAEHRWGCQLADDTKRWCLRVFDWRLAHPSEETAKPS